MNIRVRQGNQDLVLDCKNCIKLVEALKELNDINKFQQDFTIPISIPFSDINDSIYKQYGIGEEIPVHLGSPMNSDEFSLYFRSRSAKRRKYKIELSVSSSNWLECAAKTRLCDLGLGTYEFTTANVLFDWQNGKDRYQTGDSGVYPFIANYGSFLEPETLSTSDLRLAISPLFLLEKGLCHCGVTLNAPVMQTVTARHQWDYLLKNNFWEYEGHGLLVNAEMELSTTTTSTSAVIPIDTIISDPGGNVNLVAGEFQTYDFAAKGDYCVCAEGDIENPLNIAKSVRFYGGGSGEGEFNVTLQPFERRTVSFCIDINRAIGISGALFHILNPLIFHAGFNIKVIGKRKGFYEGDIIPVNEILSCEKTVLDILKAQTHLYNSKLDFDKTNQAIFISAPFSNDVYGETFEGYYKDIQHNVKLENVVCDSKSESRLQEPERYFTLCFNDPSDAYINSEEESGNRSESEAENGVLSYLYDFGFDNTNEKKSCNPCYEPTLNDFTTEIVPIAALPENQQEYYIPQLLDNLDGNITYQINPRTFYIFSGQQVTNGLPVEIIFNGVPVTFYPTAYQELPSNVDIVNSPDFARQQLTYEEHFNLYYKKHLERTFAASKDTFCLLIDYKEYEEASFRTLYSVKYGGENYTGILTKKRWNSCEKEAIWEFLRQQFKEC